MIKFCCRAKVLTQGLPSPRSFQQILHSNLNTRDLHVQSVGNPTNTTYPNKNHNWVILILEESRCRAETSYDYLVGRDSDYCVILHRLAHDRETCYFPAPTIFILALATLDGSHEAGKFHQLARARKGELLTCRQPV